MKTPVHLPLLRGQLQCSLNKITKHDRNYPFFRKSSKETPQSPNKKTRQVHKVRMTHRPTWHHHGDMPNQQPNTKTSNESNSHHQCNSTDGYNLSQQHILATDSAGTDTGDMIPHRVQGNRKIALSFEEMKPYLYCPQGLAARLLNVSLSTLKRRFYDSGKQYTLRSLVH